MLLTSDKVMKVEKIFNGSVITVTDPDLQIRGVPVIQTPEIRDGGGLQKFFFSPLGISLV